MMNPQKSPTDCVHCEGSYYLYICNKAIIQWHDKRTIFYQTRLHSSSKPSNIKSECTCSHVRQHH